MDAYFLTEEFSRKTVVLTRTSGLLSLIGSSLILRIIFSDRRNKLKRIHFRLLVGICCTDTLYSAANVISTAAIPRNTPEVYHIYGNVGTAASCKAQGFFYQWGIVGVPLYMASLSLYFLLVIRYKMKDEDISRRIEPVMHCVSILIPFALAIVGLCLNLYHNKRMICWIEAEPWGCTVIEDLECTSAKRAPIYEVLFGGIWILAVIIFEILSMCMIYLSVRAQEKAINAFAFRSSSDRRVLAPTSTKTSSESKDTAIQACLYIIGFVLTYFWPFGSYIMYRLGRPPSRAYILVTSFFVPLLGFWNFVAYIRPRYARVSRANKDKNFIWKLRFSIIPSHLDTTTDFQRKNELSKVPSRRRTFSCFGNKCLNRTTYKNAQSIKAKISNIEFSKQTLDSPINQIHTDLPTTQNNTVGDVTQITKNQSTEAKVSRPPLMCGSIDEQSAMPDPSTCLTSDLTTDNAIVEECDSRILDIPTHRNRRMSLSDILASPFSYDDESESDTDCQRLP